MTNPNNYARRVAEAIVRSSTSAGRTHNVSGESDTVRTNNLLRETNYGAYIVEGDPSDWGGGGALATIYLEPKGTKGDCEIPLDYYGGGILVAMKASNELKDAFIEFVNPAVACVYPG